LTCRQRKTYSPLPRWLQISVANKHSLVKFSYKQGF
ncbi:hypothetical protein T09_12219, partial [Trichinella sp. T9]